MYQAAVVGATGIVGQQFIVALQKHPWFQIHRLAASPRSAGKKYGEALKDPRTGAMGWFCEEEPLPEVLEIKVDDGAALDISDCDVVFTALEAENAAVLEPKYAALKPVISTASAFRYEPDVPILVPGVNSEHAVLLDRQRERRGFKGFITPIPNCTTTGLTVTLKPLYSRFGLRTVLMTSMQAISGAGRSPGVIALDIIDNIIPYIPKEEEKVQTETLKILGRYRDGRIIPADFKLSCTCTRANVKDGHTESVFLSTEKECGAEDAKTAMASFGENLRALELPSAPKRMIVVHEDPFRPQPRLDRNTEDGMATTVGRVRRDEALPNGLKYMLVSHNTKMGAAKGAVLVAELLVKKAYIG